MTPFSQSVSVNQTRRVISFHFTVDVLFMRSNPFASAFIIYVQWESLKWSVYLEPYIQDFKGQSETASSKRPSIFDHIFMFHKMRLDKRKAVLDKKQHFGL